MKKKIPIYVYILIAMAIGLVVGMIANRLGYSHIISDWVYPFGNIFLKLLKMTAIPLVFVSLVKGVAGLNNISQLASMGIKTILLYVVTTMISVVVGIGLVYSIKPGELVSKEITDALMVTYAENVENQVEKQDVSPLQPLVDIVPENLFQAMTNNSAMLQVIFLAFLIGVAVILVGNKTKPFTSLIDSLDHILMKIIDIIMMYAPFGVFALIAGFVATSGDVSVLKALGVYTLTVILGLLILTFIFYPLLIKFFTNLKVGQFVKALIPVQLVAISTSSSAATLSTTMKTANEVLKLPKSVISFTLPVGVTINMNGTSCYQAIGAVFIAQVMGIDLSFGEILTIILTTTIASIGTPGVPGGSIVILMMVLTSVGIPEAGLALILGVDRPIDMVRTAVNVTGDVAVSAIVTKTDAPNGYAEEEKLMEKNIEN